MKWLALAIFVCGTGTAADEEGKILRPVDKSAFRSGPVRVIATAPEGQLELDGQPLTPERPFPNVLTALVGAKSGEHKLALIWKDGRKEITFSVGADVPAGFLAFHPHPPPGDPQCTQCHGLSQRGRFVFKGGCFECHSREPFVKVHTHTADVLSECGLCHNAHGSTTKAHLLFTKELACKQCHN